MAWVRITFYAKLNEKSQKLTACAEELENEEVIKTTPFVKTKQMVTRFFFFWECSDSY